MLSFVNEHFMVGVVLLNVVMLSVIMMGALAPYFIAILNLSTHLQPRLNCVTT
jgi:hypothetical protein